MKRQLILFLLLLATAGTAFGQTDRQAKALLDKTAAHYRKAASVSIRFEGSTQGTLLLQDECFVIDCGDIISWYDGHHQWSYVKSNQEVTLTTPSAEELNAVHPYAWVNRYDDLFNGTYTGTKTVGGKTVQEVVLTPKGSSDLASITLQVTADGQPASIALALADGSRQTFRIRSYQTGQRQDISAFRFDPTRYPGVELIDLTTNEELH